jgi:predicted esterase
MNVAAWSRREVLGAAAVLGLAGCTGTTRTTRTANGIHELVLRHGDRDVRCLARSSVAGVVPPLAVVLLHGAGADATQWVDIGLAAAVDRVASSHVTPLVAVAPDVDPAILSAFVFETLLPAIEQRDHPHGAFAISGISRGAGEALDLALAAPHRFESVGLHSPAVPRGVAPTRALGPVFVDAGSADPLRDGARRLADGLRSAGVRVTTSWPLGRHDRAYWRAHLEQYLDFHVGVHEGSM